MKYDGITILGLGPGDPQLITRQAWDILENSAEIYIRIKNQPMVKALPAHLLIHSFDNGDDQSTQTDDMDQHIVRTLLELGGKGAGVIYAVPGDPVISEEVVIEIKRQAEERNIPVRIVSGMSFIEPLYSALKINLLPQTVFFDADNLTRLNVPPYPPSLPAVITHIQSHEVASKVKRSLLGLFPGEHCVKLVHTGRTPDLLVEEIDLVGMDKSRNFSYQTYLYVPPLDYRTSFEAFLEVIAHLRGPDGCPWDRQQDYKSLRSDLLEETYETLDALDAEDSESLREELGDLLLLILLLSQIASERGDFRISDVIAGIHRKIVNRHPHVFGDLDLLDDDILRNWESLKAEERYENGKGEQSLLDGVSLVLPALTQAQIFQKRAARVGFDWTNIRGVLEKFHEELDEFMQADTAEQRGMEVGDLIFSLVNLARWSDVDAESALRETNMRFYQRFSYIEKKVKKQGSKLQDMTIDELEGLWQEAKNSNSLS